MLPAMKLCMAFLSGCIGYALADNSPMPQPLVDSAVDRKLERKPSMRNPDKQLSDTSVDKSEPKGWAARFAEMLKESFSYNAVDKKPERTPSMRNPHKQRSYAAVDKSVNETLLDKASGRQSERTPSMRVSGTRVNVEQEVLSPPPQSIVESATSAALRGARQSDTVVKMVHANETVRMPCAGNNSSGLETPFFGDFAMAGDEEDNSEDRTMAQATMDESNGKAQSQQEAEKRIVERVHEAPEQKGPMAVHKKGGASSMETLIKEKGERSSLGMLVTESGDIGTYDVLTGKETELGMTLEKPMEVPEMTKEEALEEEAMTNEAWLAKDPDNVLFLIDGGIDSIWFGRHGGQVYMPPLEQVSYIRTRQGDRLQIKDGDVVINEILVDAANGKTQSAS